MGGRHWTSLGDVWWCVPNRKVSCSNLRHSPLAFTKSLGQSIALSILSSWVVRDSESRNHRRHSLRALLVCCLLPLMTAARIGAGDAVVSAGPKLILRVFGDKGRGGAGSGNPINQRESSQPLTVDLLTPASLLVIGASGREDKLMLSECPRFTPTHPGTYDSGANCLRCPRFQSSRSSLSVVVRNCRAERERKCQLFVGAGWSASSWSSTDGRKAAAGWALGPLLSGNTVSLALSCLLPACASEKGQMCRNQAFGLPSALTHFISQRRGDIFYTRSGFILNTWRHCMC